MVIYFFYENERPEEQEVNEKITTFFLFIQFNVNICRQFEKLT